MSKQQLMKYDHNGAMTASSEHKDQLSFLKEAVQLIDRLVSSVDDNDEDTTIHRRIDELILSSKPLDDTSSIISLAASIDKLRFRLRLVSEKADTARSEFCSLLEKLQKSKEENKTLEMENRLMKEKLERKQGDKERWSIFRSMKNRVFSMPNIPIKDEENFYSIPTMVKVEEHVLLKRSDSNLSDISDDEKKFESNSSSSSQSLEKKIFTREHQPAVYHLTFSSGKKIGLQFQKVPVDYDQTPLGQKMLSKGVDENNVDTNLRDSVPCSIFSTDTTAAHSAFLICGFHGFDRSANIKPAFGARVIAINNESLEWGLHWTDEKFRSMMFDKMTMGSSFTMTLRNDLLNVNQRHILEKAAASIEMASSKFRKK